MQIVYWIDIFTRKKYRDIVTDSLAYCMTAKGLEVYAYVIMSNHVHLIVRSDTENLSGTLGDLKKFTSKQIIKTIQEEPESRREWLLFMFSRAANQHARNKEFQVWTHENHAVLLYSEQFVSEKLDYIHNNPVRSGIVEHPEDYLYSSARNYAGLDAVLNIELLSFKWKTYS